MGFQVRFSARAERNLDEIYRYIHAESSEQARRWFKGLTVDIGSLRQLPERGKPLSARPQYRQILYGSYPHVYRVIYRVDLQDKVVTIVHIRHGAREGSGI